LLSAEGNTFGDIASQRWAYGKGLRDHRSQWLLVRA
jgi:hypothetical protein